MTKAKEPDADSDHVPVVLVDRPLRFAVIGIFLICLAAAFFFAKTFLLPVFIAVLLALVLSPIVRSLARRGIPEPASAVLLVIAAIAVIFAAVYFLSGPVTKWVNDAPQIRQQMEIKVAELRGAMEAVEEATRDLDEMTEASDPGVRPVVLREQGYFSQAASSVPLAFAQLLLILVLLLFLLASGDLFFEKLVKTLPTLTDKKRGLRIAREVERSVSHYLLTISLINIGLGMVIGLLMFAIGMPNPVLWGVMATVLNFIPYLGALIGVGIVAIVALLSFDNTSLIILAPLLYGACTTIEGNLVTPAIVGRRLEMNPVVVFLSIAFWGWLWGILGVLIAVPILVIIKIFSDHLEGLGGLSEFLAARDLPSTVVHQGKAVPD
ncbi:MAG: AI-2E family transporter [Rhizobiaceae bacterium]